MIKHFASVHLTYVHLYVTVSCQKYLGYFICDDMSDNKDIIRQTRCTYTRGNLIISKFRNCSDHVKIKLFKAYCTNFYGITLWSNFTSEIRRKLQVAYKRIFRMLMKCPMFGTTSQMIDFKLDPFDVVERKLIFGFRNR